MLKRKNETSIALEESVRNFLEKNRFKANLKRFEHSPTLQKRLDSKSYVDILYEGDS